MRIGIDIDGVLTDVEQFTVDHFSKYLVVNNIDFRIHESDYDLAKSFNVDRKHDEDFWWENIFSYAENQKPRPFASEVIKKLKNDGHEVFIVTARWLTDKEDNLGVKMRKTVEKWLNNNDIIYDKIVFTKLLERDEIKIENCLDYNIDLIIEDKPKNIIQLSTLIPVICYDNNYNRHCKGNNIYRCYSWYDIYSTINKLEAE